MKKIELDSFYDSGQKFYILNLDKGKEVIMQVPSKDLIAQTLEGATESEYLIVNGTRR